MTTPPLEQVKREVNWGVVRLVIEIGTLIWAAATVVSNVNRTNELVKDLTVRLNTLSQQEVDGHEALYRMFYGHETRISVLEIRKR